MRNGLGAARRIDDPVPQRPRRNSVAAPRAREFAFVAQSPDHLVCIGTSTNPLARLEALRQDFDDAVELVFVGLVTGPINEIRRHVWEALADRDCGGRWFDVAPDQAVGALHRAAFKLQGGLRQIDLSELDALLAAAAPPRAAPLRIAPAPPLSGGASALRPFVENPFAARLLRLLTPTKFKLTVLGFLAIFALVAASFSAKV